MNMPIQNIMQVMNMCRNGNPQAIIQQMMSANPQAANSTQALLNTGKNPQQIAMELMQQRGINPQQMMNMLGMH